MNPLFQQIHLTNFLSFGPDSKPITLKNLNVIIGPNGAGKSNLIEAFELLRATPTDLSIPLRAGGGAQEWVWKGSSSNLAPSASIDVECAVPKIRPPMRYQLAIAPVLQSFEITDERLENMTPQKVGDDVFFYYRFQNGHPIINRCVSASEYDGTMDTPASKKGKLRKLNREDVVPNQSILSQRKDPEIYPELTATAKTFSSIRIFREWQFGRSAPLRQPQRPDQQTDDLLDNLTNLGLVLNDLQHRDGVWTRLEDYCRRFLPRFKHLTTRIQSNTVQINLLEDGINGPIPATRLSDGTIRFLTLLAILLSADRYPLICIEEPELGLHPDAIALIAELLIEASEKTQLVITTHSDTLISELSDQPDSVLVCEHMAGVGTTLNRLDPAKLAFWLEKYRLGEIWRIGEIGGNL